MVRFDPIRFFQKFIMFSIILDVKEQMPSNWLDWTWRIIMVLTTFILMFVDFDWENALDE